MTFLQHPGLSAILADHGVVLLDGAQGTELERRGVNFGSSKLWSAQLLIDDPDLLRTVHLDYLRAGADIITTFTYQASLPGFAQAGLDAAAGAALLNRAVDLAAEARETFLAEREAKRDQEGTGREPEGEQEREQGKEPAGGIAARPLIAFSCGSYGGYLADGSEFRGDYAESMTLEQLADFHRARLEPVRHRTEVDLLAFETIPCLKEAEAIVELLRKERYGKPAWISFSCRDAVHTCHGEPFAVRCVPLLAAAAAEGLVAAAGVNCTAPRHVRPLLEAARARLGSKGTGTAASADDAPASAPSASAGGGDGPSGSAGAAVPSPPALPAHSVAAAPTQPQPQPQPQQGQRQEQEGPPPPLLLLCYPNSGEEWDGAHRCWRHCPDDISEPPRFAAAAASWVAGPARVSVVGGCCRTGPEHVRALRLALVRPGAGAGRPVGG